MCLSPSFVYVLLGPAYERTPIPCRVCWQCRASKINDFVGRSLAEASSSTKTCAITLTYRSRPADYDDLADKIINPRHFQNFAKALRGRGHKMRYLVAGEYGERKGRAHFHALLFFQGNAPDIAQKKRDWLPQWPHGHVYADWSADERAVRYVCKYIMKDLGEQLWFSMSKKPPLGASWFAQKAKRHIDAGVLPRSFDYMPPGGNKKRPYTMTGATRRNFITAIRDGMLREHPEKREQLSEWLALSLAKMELNEAIALGEAWVAENPELQLQAMLEELDTRRVSVRNAVSSGLQPEVERWLDAETPVLGTGVRNEPK